MEKPGRVLTQGLVEVFGFVGAVAGAWFGLWLQWGFWIVICGLIIGFILGAIAGFGIAKLIMKVVFRQ